MNTKTRLVPITAFDMLDAVDGLRGEPKLESLRVFELRRNDATVGERMMERHRNKGNMAYAW